MAEPIFRQTIEECDTILQYYADWSLLTELTRDEEHSRIEETQIAQPTNFAIQVALAALWRSWGIEPSAIVGHSAGEPAAAYVAGALSLKDALKVVFHRSRLQQQTAGQGKMAAIGLSYEEAQQLLVGYEDRLSIAAINSPTSVTLSGNEADLETISKVLEDRKVFFRLLRVNVAYHSPTMNPLKEELLEVLQDIEPQTPIIPLWSTVTGEKVDRPELNEMYWWQNMRQPVFFAASMNKLAEAGYDLFLEISPHPVLAGSISECFISQNRQATVLTSIRRKEAERQIMLTSLAALYSTFLNHEVQ
jgi:acyl transferase domain-containing protein